MAPKIKRPPPSDNKDSYPNKKHITNLFEKEITPALFKQNDKPVEPIKPVCPV